MIQTSTFIRSLLYFVPVSRPKMTEGLTVDLTWSFEAIYSRESSSTGIANPLNSKDCYDEKRRRHMPEPPLLRLSSASRFSPQVKDKLGHILEAVIELLVRWNYR
jgi:hypothetical protein